MSNMLKSDANPEGVPISELWNEAYDKLSTKEPSLVKSYEAALDSSFTLGIASSALALTGIKIARREQMQAILKHKLAEVEKGTWKIGFNGNKLAVRDLAGSVASITASANDYMSNVLSASPSASLAWAGVGLLLPVCCV